MPGKKLTVVISQGQSKNPAQRRLEEEIALQLMQTRDVEVSLVPHLYDMAAEHTGLLFLKSIPGDLVILSWMYPRAARWILDRQGIHGKEGFSLLKEEIDSNEVEGEADWTPAGGQFIGEIPDRFLYVIDLRLQPEPAPYIEEVQRIASSNAHQVVELATWITGHPHAEQMQRYLAQQPSDGVLVLPSPQDDAPPKRRWYPVIDYSRCTNCMECIDFCLFGVYGVDHSERILVEAQDNCKKGCPACSRVCPENAIIFPQHKTPAIAGADGEIAGLKIDLSLLFGGSNKSALEIAAAERDNELVRDGREAVGMTVGIPKRQSESKFLPKDDLDQLLDRFDALQF